jgi:hypothetical protein
MIPRARYQSGQFVTGEAPPTFGSLRRLERQLSLIQISGGALKATLYYHATALIGAR